MGPVGVGLGVARQVSRVQAGPAGIPIIECCYFHERACAAIEPSRAHRFAYSAWQSTRRPGFRLPIQLVVIPALPARHVAGIIQCHGLIEIGVSVTTTGLVPDTAAAVAAAQ